MLDVRAGGQQWRWYVDASAGRLLRTQYQGTGQAGPATITVDLSDWKAVDGVMFPFHTEISTDGNPTATGVISSYEVNPTVDPKLFERPVRASEQR